MTQVKTGDQPFDDPEMQAREADRRAELAHNPGYARGIADAQRNFKENVQREFDDELANLKRVTAKRGATSASWDVYDRCYWRVAKVAERLAGLLGRPVQIPKHLKRPEAVEEFATIEPPKFDLGEYQERGSRKATGVQPNFANPESKETQDWLTMQGVSPLSTDGMSPAEASIAMRKRAGAK